MRVALVVAVWGLSVSAAPPPPEKAPDAPAAGRSVRASLAVDGDRACAIKANGKVACWGRSGTHVDSLPVEVPALDEVVGLAAGSSATCAWTARGAVACWGADVKKKFAPKFDDVVQVTVGEGSACGLHGTGRVSCWANGSGAARDVTGLTDAVELAGGYGVGAEQLCARTRSGAVTCGNQVSALEPIAKLAGATSLGGAGCRFAALLPDHRLATWVGWTGMPMPVFLDGIDAERVLVGGHRNGAAEVCVLGAHPQCWAWAGEPSLALSKSPPLPAAVRDLSLDTEATCARVGDRVECWGRLGRLGDGENEYPSDFVAVQGIADARQLEATGRTICALHGGRVACWGERLRGDDEAVGPQGIDLEPIELPGVTDAVELAMQGGSTTDGQEAAFAVCARRPGAATCWASHHGQLEAIDAPELAAAAKLYSGPAICGVLPKGVVHCLRLSSGGGSVAGFSNEDYQRYVYPHAPDVAAGKVTRELEKRMQAALKSNRLPAGFHGSGGKLLSGRSDRTFQPPVDKLTEVIEARRLEWTVEWNGARLRGVLCARRSDGTVVCWGERDSLGAGQHSSRAEPRAVTP